MQAAQAEQADSPTMPLISPSSSKTSSRTLSKHLDGCCEDARQACYALEDSGPQGFHSLPFKMMATSALPSGMHSIDGSAHCLCHT